MFEKQFYVLRCCMLRDVEIEQTLIKGRTKKPKQSANDG